MQQVSDLYKSGIAYITDPRAGHGPTATYLFLASSHTLSFFSKPDMFQVCYQSQWEPYYILPRKYAPLYDERFLNQGGDKQQHAMLLNALGWTFYVLRHVYLFHRDHAHLQWPGGGLDWKTNAFSYFDEWDQEMSHNFGMTRRWPRGCSATSAWQQGWRMDVRGIGIG
jgi:hypothetical protein